MHLTVAEEVLKITLDKSIVKLSCNNIINVLSIEMNTFIHPLQAGDLPLLQEACEPKLDLCHVQAEQIYWTHEDQGKFSNESHVL